MFFLVRLQRTTFVSKPTLRNDKKCKIKTSHIWSDLSEKFTLTKLFQITYIPTKTYFINKIDIFSNKKVTRTFNFIWYRYLPLLPITNVTPFDGTYLRQVGRYRYVTVKYLYLVGKVSFLIFSLARFSISGWFHQTGSPYPIRDTYQFLPQDDCGCFQSHSHSNRIRELQYQGIDYKN